MCVGAAVELNYSLLHIREFSVTSGLSVAMVTTSSVLFFCLWGWLGRKAVWVSLTSQMLAVAKEILQLLGGPTSLSLSLCRQGLNCKLTIGWA